jgi:hypothetical protein
LPGRPIERALAAWRPCTIRANRWACLSLKAFSLAHAVVYAGATGLSQGAAVGFFSWLGFVAVILLGVTIYEQRHLKLFFINAGFNPIGLALMGAFLAVWR